MAVVLDQLRVVSELPDSAEIELRGVTGLDTGTVVVTINLPSGIAYTWGGLRRCLDFWFAVDGSWPDGGTDPSSGDVPIDGIGVLELTFSTATGAITEVVGSRSYRDATGDFRDPVDPDGLSARSYVLFGLGPQAPAAGGTWLFTWDYLLEVTTPSGDWPLTGDIVASYRGDPTTFTFELDGDTEIRTGTSAAVTHTWPYAGTYVGIVRCLRAGWPGEIQLSRRITVNVFGLLPFDTVTFDADPDHGRAPLRSTLHVVPQSGTSS